MNPETLHLQAIWAALAAAVIAGIGEWLYTRRLKRVQALAFGPAGRPRRWTVIAPACRIVGVTALAWSLVTLLSFDRLTRERDGRKPPDRNLMILLDVSPSMLLKDGGENGTQTRNERAAAVLKSVLDRIPGDRVRFTAAGFYTETRLLVKECQDRELILHLVGGTPFHITYDPGKTDLLKSLNQAGVIMKGWDRKSTTLLVISDGDSVPPSGLNPMPSSVAEVIFAGVGDSSRGTFIDGHVSRQDTSTLSQLARRLHGTFYDCNVKHVPSEALKKLNAEDTGTSRWRTDRRFVALAALAVSSVLLCLVPLALEYLGSAWRPRPAPLRSLQPRLAP